MTTAGGGTARILVVDDDPDIADVVSMMLTELGGHETQRRRSPADRHLRPARRRGTSRS